MFNSNRRRITMGRLMVLCLLYLFSAQLQATDKISYTGFLPHYPDLKPDPDYKGAFKWKNPESDLKKYDKIMVAPLEVWLSPDSEYKGLSADQISLINRMYQGMMVQIMEPDYPIVGTRGYQAAVG